MQTRRWGRGPRRLLQAGRGRCGTCRARSRPGGPTMQRGAIRYNVSAGAGAGRLQPEPPRGRAAPLLSRALGPRPGEGAEPPAARPGPARPDPQPGPQPEARVAERATATSPPRPPCAPRSPVPVSVRPSVRSATAPLPPRPARRPPSSAGPRAACDQGAPEPGPRRCGTRPGAQGTRRPAGLRAATE
jgi:hypothetical protein